MTRIVRPFLFALLAVLAVLPAPRAAAQATPGTVSVNGATIAYRVQGHGPALMLIHGYPLSGELFARNRDALSKSYTVVTPDLRGFGRSVAPDTKGSVQIYAQDMLAVMDHLNIKTAIIGGMSMGGPVVFEMYREAPQRFRGMILIDTTAAPPSFVEQGEWPGFANQANEKGVPSMVPLLLPVMLTAETRVGHPEQAAFLTGIVDQCSLNGAYGGASTLANRPDSMPTLATITVPTLILAGMDDGLYALEMQKMMQMGIKGSRLVLIPMAAHAAIYEKADAADRAILQFAGGIK